MVYKLLKKVDDLGHWLHLDKFDFYYRFCAWCRRKDDEVEF